MERALKLFFVAFPCILWNFDVLSLQSVVAFWAGSALLYLGARYYLKRGDAKVLEDVRRRQEQFHAEQEAKRNGP